MSRGSRSTQSLAEISRLVEDHLPLVGAIVRQVVTGWPRHVDREELAAAGRVGLLEAARRWDPERGVIFRIYAATRIRGAVLDAARESDWAPRSLRTAVRELDHAEAALLARNGRPASPAEVADELGITIDRVNAIRGRAHQAMVSSLEQTVDPQGEVQPVSDTDTPEIVAETAELRAFLRAAIAMLPERQRMVIVGFDLEGKSGAELAELLGVTPSRVSQLRAEALAAMRDVIAAGYEGTIDLTERSGRAAERQASYLQSVLDEVATSAQLAGVR